MKKQNNTTNFKGVIIPNKMNTQELRNLNKFI